MRTLISKFQSFPEWNDMDRSINVMLNNQTKEKSEAALALGKNFSEFARQQPIEGISDVLLRLNDTMKQIQETKSTGNDNIPTIKTDLTHIWTLNDEIKKKRKNVEQIQYRSERSAKTAEKAESRYEAAQKKNQDTPEFQKIHDEYDLAIRQKQSDLTAFEERKALFTTEEKGYKKELFSLILSSLSQYVSAKSHAASSLVPLGDQLSNLGNQIPSYTDTSIEILETELQAVRSEPIE